MWEKVFVSLCNAGSVSTLSTRGQYSSIHGCHVDLVTEVIQAPTQALAISQDCLPGDSVAGSLGDHVAEHGEYSKVLGTKSMACGLRSSDTSNLVSWLQVSVLEAEPTPSQ